MSAKEGWLQVGDLYHYLLTYKGKFESLCGITGESSRPLDKYRPDNYCKQCFRAFKLELLRQEKLKRKTR